VKSWIREKWWWEVLKEEMTAEVPWR